MSPCIIYCDSTEGMVQIITMLLRENVVFHANHGTLTITLKGF